MNTADGKGGKHTHAKVPGGPDDGAGPDWFRVLDVVVWVSVAVIAVMGIEWLIGRVVRESLAAGASRYLRKVDAAAPEGNGA